MNIKNLASNKPALVGVAGVAAFVLTTNLAAYLGSRRRNNKRLKNTEAELVQVHVAAANVYDNPNDRERLRTDSQFWLIVAEEMNR